MIVSHHRLRVRLEKIHITANEFLSYLLAYHFEKSHPREFSLLSVRESAMPRDIQGTGTVRIQSQLSTKRRITWVAFGSNSF